MNDKRLRIYLDDHLALMAGEIQLIRRCRSSNRGTPLGDFLLQLENDVETQKSIANDIRHCFVGRLNVEGKAKQIAAWLAEKLGRLKLNDSFFRYSELSRVVELETLAAAAQERIAVWDNFDALASQDARFEGVTFSFFREQSRQHLEELDTRRRFAAVEAFAGDKNASH